MGLVVAVVIPSVQCWSPTSKSILFTRTLTKTQGDFTGFQWQRWTSWVPPTPTCVHFFFFFPLIPSCSFNLYFSLKSLQRFTIAVVDRKKGGRGVGKREKQREGERTSDSWWFLFISMMSGRIWLLQVEMHRRESLGICPRHSGVTMTLLWERQRGPPQGVSLKRHKF